MTGITITHVPGYLNPVWTDQTPREGWTVECSDHAYLGKDHSGYPWGYGSEARGRMVATRHGRAKHSGGYTVREIGQ